MKIFRQAVLGIGIALASLILVLGAFSLSMAEGVLAITPTLAPTNSATMQQSASPVKSPSPSPTFTLTASITITPSITLTFTWTPTPSPSPTICPHPLGWVPYIVRQGDTLSRLATFYKVSVADLQRGNCLLTTELSPGTTIYVPFAAPTPTKWACGRPPGWVTYIVQPGDTLYHLSLIYGVSVAQLQQANCIIDPNDLRVGQVIYVPYTINPTPLPTFGPTFGPTIGPIIPSETPTFTPQPTDTPVPTEPEYPTPQPPSTDVPYPTYTPVPTEIPIPTETAATP